MDIIRLRYIEGILTERYPFRELRNVGDEIIIEGGFLQLIQNAAYRYSKNHKMRILTRALPREGELERVYCRRVA